MKIADIKELLTRISPWPWSATNPAQTFWLRHSPDVEFMHKSPELVAQLLRMVEVAKEGLVRIRDIGDGMDDHDTAIGALAELKRLEDE